jgi:hypothetical protein
MSDISSDMGEGHHMDIKWRPIQDAPRDGRLIRVTDGRRVWDACYLESYEDWSADAAWCGLYSQHPTHWKPLERREPVPVKSGNEVGCDIIGERYDSE